MNHRHVSVLTVIGLVACLGACAAPPAPDSPVEVLSQAEARAIIDRLNSEWDAAVVAGSLEAAVAQYTDAAIRMEPGRPALVGKEAILAWMQSQFDRFTFEGANVIDEVVVLSPDWILVRSHGEFVGTSKDGGETREFKEKWLSLLQRQADGSWKYHRDSGSSDVQDPWK